MRLPLCILVLLSACAPVVLGGESGPGGREPITECEDDGDCAPGSTCELGMCFAEPPTACETAEDCPMDYTCEGTGSESICVPPEEPPVVGCDECFFPDMCVDDVCVEGEEPSPFCSLDSECEEDFLCIAGVCRPDPRIARACTDELSPEAFIPNPEGICECEFTADCPIGTLCIEGECLPPEGCIADDECPGEMLCDSGICVPEGTCDVVHPDLSTDPVWNVSSMYNFREALPGWLDGFLDAVSGPFRFLAGDSEDPDLGLPGFIEGLIGDAIRGWAEENLPPYVLSAFGGIADLNDILSTWLVEERMHLDRGDERDEYRGRSEWVQVAFEYRDMMMVGTPEDIIGWSTEPDYFDARAVCGTFNIEQHDVEIGIGAIIAWVLDVVVYESSDGRYDDLEMLADDVSRDLCREARTLAEGIYSGAGGLAESWCNSTIGTLVDRMIMAINDAMLNLDLVRLKGFSPIIDGNNLRPGVWEGSLIGGDFGGTWSAER
ncbi:MAG: EB domain-containing protein [Polyangiales bacterium]